MPPPHPPSHIQGAGWLAGLGEGAPASVEHGAAPAALPQRPALPLQPGPVRGAAQPDRHLDIVAQVTDQGHVAVSARGPEGRHGVRTRSVGLHGGEAGGEARRGEARLIPGREPDAVAAPRRRGAA
jgi:hypothetical protein